MEKEAEKMLIYKPENAVVPIDVAVKDEDIWLTQKAMAELFETTISNISMHIKNIYEENQLVQNRTIKKSLMVQKEGEREIKREVLSYNLDVIIAVRVSYQFQESCRFSPVVNTGFEEIY